jgi:hypothetical protein
MDADDGCVEVLVHWPQTSGRWIIAVDGPPPKQAETKGKPTVIAHHHRRIVARVDDPYAERLVACWNFLRGVSAADLATGDVEMVCGQLLDPRGLVICKAS